MSEKCPHCGEDAYPRRIDGHDDSDWMQCRTCGREWREIPRLRRQLAQKNEENARLKAGPEWSAFEAELTKRTERLWEQIKAEWREEVIGARVARDTADAKVHELQAVVEKLHPRVLKLAASGKAFIPIGEHEPYYLAAYRMVRDQEKKQGTWTEECEAAFAAASRAAEGKR